MFGILPICIVLHISLKFVIYIYNYLFIGRIRHFIFESNKIQAGVQIHQTTNEINVVCHIFKYVQIIH